MAEQFWAACRTFSGREHVVREEIEKMDRGAFLPTIVRSSITCGKLTVGERAAMPGYVLFRSRADDWPPVNAIDGVVGVLLNGERPMRVSPKDMVRLMIDHASGAHDDFTVRVAPPKRGRTKSRRPRASKRARVPRSVTVP